MLTEDLKNTIKPSHKQVEQKEKEGIRMGFASQGGNQRKGSCTLGRFFTSKEIRLGRGQVSEPKRGEEQLVCGRQNRVTCTKGWHNYSVFPNLTHSSVSEGGGQVLKLRLQRSVPEKIPGIGVETA